MAALWRSIAGEATQAPKAPAASCRPPLGDIKPSHEACMSHLLSLSGPPLGAHSERDECARLGHYYAINYNQSM